MKQCWILTKKQRHLDHLLVDNTLYGFKRGWKPRKRGFLVNVTESIQMADIALQGHLDSVFERVYDAIGTLESIQLEHPWDIVAVNGFMLEYPLIYCLDKPTNDNALANQDLVLFKQGEDSFTVPVQFLDLIDTQGYEISSVNRERLVL